MFLGKANACNWDQVSCGGEAKTNFGEDKRLTGGRQITDRAGQKPDRNFVDGLFQNVSKTNGSQACNDFIKAGFCSYVETLAKTLAGFVNTINRNAQHGSNLFGVEIKTG